VKEKPRVVKRILVDLVITVRYGFTQFSLGRVADLGILSDYETAVASGDLHSDAAQIDAICELEGMRGYLESTSEKARGFAGLFRRRQAAAPKGLYLWGGVGAGKSMLMDMFFAATDISRKRRIHFHAFMQEIHAGMHDARATGVEDPLEPVAAKVIDQARLLCFDEMQITDITDAMIVGRLFEKLLAAGIVIVTTSNRAPGDLYKDGLNRQLFLPFISLLEERMALHHLQSAADYRQNRLRGTQTWFTPADETARAAIDKLWQDLTTGQGGKHQLHVKKRIVEIPAFHNGAARADFADICAKPLGPADFLAIAEAARVLILENIPVMNRARNNEAKRFVTLIDTLYEAKTKLIATADAEPEQLYQEGAGSFEFERTASRLREMQSADWAENT